MIKIRKKKEKKIKMILLKKRKEIFGMKWMEINRKIFLEILNQQPVGRRKIIKERLEDNNSLNNNKKKHYKQVKSQKKKTLK